VSFIPSDTLTFGASRVHLERLALEIPDHFFSEFYLRSLQFFGKNSNQVTAPTGNHRRQLPINTKPHKFLKEAQLKEWATALQNKRKVDSDLSLIGPFLRRASNLSFFLRKQGASMLKSNNPPAAILRAAHRYQESSCPCCDHNPESNHHFLYECQHLVTYRSQLNPEVEEIAALLQIPLDGLFNLQTNPLAPQAWRGYLPIQVTNQIQLPIP